MAGMQTTVSITVRGSRALERKLKKMSAAMRSELAFKAVRKGAEIVKAAIQDKILEWDLYDSGALYKSVLISPGKGKLRTIIYEVSTEVVGDYDWVHEYGATIEARRRPFMIFEIDGELIFAKRVTIPARPYFRPGVEESRPEARWVMGESFKQLVLKAAV